MCFDLIWSYSIVYETRIICSPRLKSSWSRQLPRAPQSLKLTSAGSFLYGFLSKGIGYRGIGIGKRRLRFASSQRRNQNPKKIPDEIPNPKKPKEPSTTKKPHKPKTPKREKWTSQTEETTNTKQTKKKQNPKETNTNNTNIPDEIQYQRKHVFWCWFLRLFCYFGFFGFRFRPDLFLCWCICFVWFPWCFRFFCHRASLTVHYFRFGLSPVWCWCDSLLLVADGFCDFLGLLFLLDFGFSAVAWNGAVGDPNTSSY